MNNILDEDASAPLGKLTESYKITQDKLNVTLNKFHEQYKSINKSFQPNVNANSIANNDVLTSLNYLTEHVSVSSLRLQMSVKTQLIQVKTQLLAVDLLAQV
jgi:tyrosyl-tRNA synthetase